MAQLKKETNRRVVGIQGYKGVCNGCNSPVEYIGEMRLVEIEETDKEYFVVPIDIFSCPYCFSTVITMSIYKSLDVAEEIKNEIRS